MRFELLTGGEKQVVEWEGVACGQMPCVFEDKPYGIVIHGGQADKHYTLRIGEERLNLQEARFSTDCVLQGGMYFESAFATTKLFILSLDEEGTETLETECECYVVPSKIGHDNYRRMVADLQSICQALLNDLIGKSQHGQEWDETIRILGFRSRQEELTAMRRTWNALRPLIGEISLAPTSHLIRKRVMAVGGKHLSPRDVVAMMKRGVNPHIPSPWRKCPTFRLKESVDVLEHRLIRGFMEYLLRHLEQCRESIKNDLHAIEADRPFRSQTSHQGQVSLYEMEDLPRLSKLHGHERQINAMSGEIQEMIACEFWRGVSPVVEYPEPKHFAENECYIQIANAILRYLKNGFNMLETVGGDVMTKKSSKMYEQWVLIQLVSAFEHFGMAMETWDSVIQRCTREQFILNFGKNTRFFAKLTGHYGVMIRYEPWIAPRLKIAKYPKETLCHFGQQDDTYWRPDFVVELLNIEDRQHPRTELAIVMDAKYSLCPSEEMRRSVEKYGRIRSSDGGHGRQVTQQVWFVYPGRPETHQGVFICDEAMTFLPSFGPIYADGTHERVEYTDHFRGEIILRPEEEVELIKEGENMRGISVHKPMLDFAEGTLAYFRYVVKQLEQK